MVLQVIWAKNLKKHNFKAFFILSSALLVVALASCGKNEKWLKSEILFKTEKWLSCKESLVSSQISENEFFLKVIRINDSMSGIYVDKFNEVNAKIHESLTSLTASMNIQQDPGTEIFSQLIIRINKENLSYSKKTNLIQKDFYGDWVSIGGIDVPNAGACSISEKPPKQAI